MTPSEFRVQLKATAKRLGLTASDLAIWFDRPRPTVHVWLWKGIRPRPGTVFDEIQSRFKLLEQSPDLPVPYEVYAKSRRSYITAAREHALHGGVVSNVAGVPAIDSSVDARGVVLSNGNEGQKDAADILQPDRRFTTSYKREQGQ